MGECYECGHLAHVHNNAEGPLARCTRCSCNGYIERARTVDVLSRSSIVNGRPIGASSVARAIIDGRLVKVVEMSFEEEPTPFPMDSVMCSPGRCISRARDLTVTTVDGLRFSTRDPELITRHRKAGGADLTRYSARAGG